MGEEIEGLVGTNKNPLNWEWVATVLDWGLGKITEFQTNEV